MILNFDIMYRVIFFIQLGYYIQFDFMLFINVLLNFRLGEFVDDYDKKKVDMQKVEEEISFNYYKKKV